MPTLRASEFIMLLDSYCYTLANQEIAFAREPFLRLERCIETLSYDLVEEKALVLLLRERDGGFSFSLKVCIPLIRIGGLFCLLTPNQISGSATCLDRILSL